MRGLWISVLSFSIVGCGVSAPRAPIGASMDAPLDNAVGLLTY